MESKHMWHQIARNMGIPPHVSRQSGAKPWIPPPGGPVFGSQVVLDGAWNVKILVGILVWERKRGRERELRDIKQQDHFFW